MPEKFQKLQEILLNSSESPLRFAFLVVKVRTIGWSKSLTCNISEPMDKVTDATALGIKLNSAPLTNEEDLVPKSESVG